MVQIEIRPNVYCAGWYAVAVGGNTVVTTFAPVTVNVVENANFTIVTCKGIDGSGRYETNAEVGYTDNCIFGALSGGTGTLTRANNGDTNGGHNISIHCKFANP